MFDQFVECNGCLDARIWWRKGPLEGSELSEVSFFLLSSPSLLAIHPDADPQYEPARTLWIALILCDNNTTDPSETVDVFTLAKGKGAVAAVSSDTCFTSTFSSRKTPGSLNPLDVALADVVGIASLFEDGGGVCDCGSRGG